MKLMTCPLNGERNISEFVYGGEVVDMPNPAACSDQEWSAYLFIEENTKGIVKEWWMHAASSYWFIAERNTETNEIIRTFPSSELYMQRVDFRAAKE
ncbi:MAG: sarcosine oxidase subunit delta [Gammaproteobacteria bacterium]|jgi:sarcosine oxidase subunit delta|nr:sarcosine oxidase subunit delta [Gammaproteobacteria bacterium]